MRNNSLATLLMARTAGEFGVETFVLISTDKAVKPATVMGASKALAEWAVEAQAASYPNTRYATVRFGNVLGSSGSVVPIFRRQIAAGGPVTVTDERMTRYFMTIPEAVQLVIRAGSLTERSGEVFVLEMGEPIKIVDARRDDDPPVRARARPRHRDRDRRRARRREVPGGAPQPLRARRSRRRRRRSSGPSAQPLDPAWVKETFDHINLLVLEGDAADARRARFEARRTACERRHDSRCPDRVVDSGASHGHRPVRRYRSTSSLTPSETDVGFASIIAVAILILLYFAHARETATLRDRLDEAQARIGGLEARIAQMLHAQAAAQRGRAPAPVAPPPGMAAAARPPGSASTSVRRVPRPATAAAGAARRRRGPRPWPAAAAMPRLQAWRRRRRSGWRHLRSHPPPG